MGNDRKGDLWLAGVWAKIMPITKRWKRVGRELEESWKRVGRAMEKKSMSKDSFGEEHEADNSFVIEAGLKSLPF